MTARTFADLTSVLASLFADQVTNQINRACVLAQVLDVRPGTGKNFQWVAKVGTPTPSGAVIADGADVSTFNKDTKLPAVLQYGTYHDAFAVTGKALAAARAAQNPRELAALLVDELGDSVERIARAIAAHVYTGSGATDTIHGLRDSSAPGVGDVGTYAGISRASHAQWKSSVVDGAGADLSEDGDNDIKKAFNLLRSLRRQVVLASGEAPDIYVTSPIQHERIGLAYQAHRRYVDEVRRADGAKIRLDGGFNVLEFDGYSVIEDPLCPADEVIALNTRHVHLTQLADSPDMLSRAMGEVQLGGTPEPQFGARKMGLRARIQPLAITGDALKFALYCYPQIVVRRPNACGVIENLDDGTS